MPSAWTELRAAVDPFVRPYNLYTAYTISRAEHVATVAGDVDGVRAALAGAGYEPQWLSAAKRHPDTGQLHDLSYRRVPSTHPPATVLEDGTIVRLGREFTPRECQHHVHAFGRGDVVDVFRHYEARPDFLEPSVSPARLAVHYRPEYGHDYLRGLDDPAVELPDAV